MREHEFELKHKYLVVVGVRDMKVLPIIRKSHRVLECSKEMTLDEVLDTARVRDWIPSNARWYEVYKLTPMVSEGKTHRRFDWRSDGKQHTG